MLWRVVARMAHGEVGLRLQVWRAKKRDCAWSDNAIRLEHLEKELAVVTAQLDALRADFPAIWEYEELHSPDTWRTYEPDVCERLEAALSQGETRIGVKLEASEVIMFPKKRIC